MSNDTKTIRVIATRCAGENEYQYLGFDTNSGGYPYWSPSLHGAYLFGLFSGDDERLEKEYDAILNGPDSVMTDGTRYPNSMKHSALQLNNKKLQGRGVLEIHVLRFEVDRCDQIEGRIQRPTGYTYD